MEPTRRRNWLALAVGIFVLLFSYILYAAAFVPPEGGSPPVVDAGLIAIALVIAPLGFSSIALISHRPSISQALLRSMGILVVVGLAFGLLSPILGAAAGLGVGIAISLNMPDFEGQLRRRLVAVALAVVYMLAMLVLIPPAGVLAGGVLPGLMVGFADEYGAWREARTGAS